uniref:Uncharacterized protein n=1 Tax=Ditylenchus dipsaci TaxID=166011 RepID=A0A915CW99_9BILA
MLSTTQLADPCEFPSPTDPVGFSPFTPATFSTICQLDYHQVSYLCDPSGMLSRTEAEILDRQINATGCICPTIPSSNTANRYSQVRQNSIPLACTPQFKRHNNGLRLALALVPFSSINSVNTCLERRKHLARRSGAEEDEDRQMAADKSQPHTYKDAAMAYGQMLVDRWTATSARTGACDVDLFMVYVQHWVPTNLKHPFLVRLFRSRLKRLNHLNTVHSADKDANPFETLLYELTQAIQLINGSTPEQEGGRDEEARQSLSPNKASLNSDDQTNSKKDSQNSSSSTMGGVPSWAYFVGFGLVALVLVTVYAASLVNRKLVSTQQQKKYMAMNARSGGGGAGTGVGAANERWKAGLASSGGNNASATMLQNGMTMSSGGGGAIPQATTKSSMMFRQFSGAGKRGIQKNNPHIQKI